MAKAPTTNRICKARSRTERAGLRRYLAAAIVIRLADEGARVALVLLALERMDSATIGLSGIAGPAVAAIVSGAAGGGT